MAKGIVVVDIPKQCCECPFFDVLEESNIMYCSVSELGHCEHLLKFIENEYLKPDWCPIKPIPNRKSEDFGQTIIAAARGEGWNECLDEILGET